MNGISVYIVSILHINIAHKLMLITFYCFWRTYCHEWNMSSITWWIFSYTVLVCKVKITSVKLKLLHFIVWLWVRLSCCLYCVT